MLEIIINNMLIGKGTKKTISLKFGITINMIKRMMPKKIKKYLSLIFQSLYKLYGTLQPIILPINKKYK